MKINRPRSKQPIPEDAEVVFKGVIFEVYQWKQRMYDGTERVFEKVKRPDTVVVFPVLDDGRIVLVEEEQPGKELSIGGAGGRVNEGEDVLEAVKRELMEETGYEAERFVLWSAEHPASKIDWVVYTFVAKGLRKSEEPEHDGGEKISLRNVTLDEFLELGTRGKFSEKDLTMKMTKARFEPGTRSEIEELFDPAS